MIVNCLFCSKEFSPPQRDVNRGFGKFCSRSCGSRGARRKPRKTIELFCTFCKNIFVRPINKVHNTKSGLYFCSRICKNSAQSLKGGCKEIWPSHYGTGKIFYGYRRVAFSYYPHKCNRCGYFEIEEILRVHHIDRNRKNGDINNLEILCPNCHEIEHFIAKDGMYSGDGAA
jgi:hypothetical protein